MAAVEALQRPRHRVAEPREALGRDPLAGGRVAEACAFDRQELEFLGAIEDAQVSIELQAVDDRRRIVQEDVLGSQVAVRLDDAAARRARIEPVLVRGNKFALRRAQHPGGGRVERREHALVGRDLCVQARGERRAVSHRRPLGLVERRQLRDQPAEIPCGHLAAREPPVEHAAAVEASHLDQPVHDVSLAADREVARGIHRQGSSAEVHLRGEAAIQPDLGLGVATPCLEAAAVHGVAPHRLVQLPGAVGREEDPGEVSLDRLIALALSALEPRDLVRQRARACGGGGRLRRSGLIAHRNRSSKSSIALRYLLA